jgi:hypothetical protein
MPADASAVAEPRPVPDPHVVRTIAASRTPAPRYGRQQCAGCRGRRGVRSESSANSIGTKVPRPPPIQRTTRIAGRPLLDQLNGGGTSRRSYRCPRPRSASMRSSTTRRARPGTPAARRWRLPASRVECVLCQHDPEKRSSSRSASRSWGSRVRPRCSHRSGAMSARMRRGSSRSRSRLPAVRGDGRRGLGAVRCPACSWRAVRQATACAAAFARMD